MKSSIKIQIAVTFFALMAFSIFSCWIINNTFLEHYYIFKKQQTLMEAYSMLNAASSKTMTYSSEFKEDFEEKYLVKNIDLLVWGAGTDQLSFVHDLDMLERELVDKVVNGSTDEIKVLQNNNKYTLLKTKDMQSSSDYIEILGMLDNGSLFIMRTPLENIRESAEIANRFLLYIGLIAIATAAVIIWKLADRITKPILELTHISGRMANLDFEAKYKSGGKNEIATLGNCMNQLSEKLECTISELKTANNELKNDIEKKTQIDEMRKEFLSNVSHELKTPIALIRGYAEGLQECINDDEESRNFYCEVIMDEADKMNKMVQKLLTLNSIEFGNDVVTLERFDISAMIRDILQSTMILAQQKGVSVLFQDGGPVYVWADEFKIEEVFTNYLSNALNHVAKENIIEVRIIHNENLVRVSVFNTGEKIPEQDIDRIWDKFYKVNKAHTREYGGSGIGLSIVKAIMDSLNKECGVINYDNGVEFWFELDFDSNHI